MLWLICIIILIVGFISTTHPLTQLELVVNKLKEISNRILIVIPYCYGHPYQSRGSRMVPNSVRKRSKIEYGSEKNTVFSDEDQVG